MNFRDLIAGSRFPQGFAEFPRVGKLGMNWRWEESGGWWMCTASPHFVRGRQYVGCSEIPRLVLCDLNVGEKNYVWGLRSGRGPNLRPQAALGAGPVGGRRQNLPGDREPPGTLPELRQGEAGE